MSLAWQVRLAGQAEQDLLDITLWTAHVKRIGGYFQHAGSCDSFLNDIPIVPEAQHENPYLALAKKTIDK